MKVKKALFILGLMINAKASFAFPGAGPGSAIDVAARDLTSSAQNLVYILNLTSPNSLAYQDAVTLVDAAQHFQEEVELGPVDLDVDFNAIEQSFTDLQGRFVTCREYQTLDQVRTSWFRVEQSNISMRQTWYGSGSGGQGPGGPGGPGFPGGGPGGWHGGDRGPGGWHGGDRGPGGWHGGDRGHDHGPGDWHDGGRR